MLASYLNLILSAAAAAMASGSAVAATTHDWWTIGTAATSAFAVAVIQHLRAPVNLKGVKPNAPTE